MIRLQPSPKAHGTRTVAAEETCRRAGPLARRFGVTRVSDITGLDRIGIPVWSSVVPKSGDFLTIYSGKGSRHADARAGAVMEAIERQAVVRSRPGTITASAIELRAHSRLADPEQIVTALSDDYSRTRPYEWIEGFDLLAACPTFVPAATAGYCWTHLEHGSPHALTTAHGMSAGNCLEEAIAQSLCEWVERDAWTLAELGSYWRRRAFVEISRGRDPGDDFDDDADLHPCIDLTGIGEPVEELLRKFRAADLHPLVRDISSDLGIPVVVASVAADEVPGFPQAHLGVGAHPDLRVAAARALTEVAQSRACDIQGVREDLAPPHGDGGAKGVVVHTRRVPHVDRRRWLHRPSSCLRPWRAIEQHQHGDMLSDIELILARLRRAGIQQAIVVDFSPPDSGIVVVRLLIPGLEAWIADRGRIGHRAAASWRPEPWPPRR
ncbi:MAG TPA: YcaO-like family protein [Vicinamibacterales bacterium]|nr:YcaO-like family protein [Vicinamibacterales bacterium]